MFACSERALAYLQLDSLYRRMVVSVSDSSAHVNDYCTGKQVDSVPCEIKLYGKLAGRDIQR